MVKVLPEDAFNSWYNDTTTVKTLAKGGETAESLDGQMVVEKYGCQACHSYDGTKLVGPSFKGIFGEKATVETSGVKREIIVDDEYIKTSIYEPEVDVVEGYRKGQMITYKGMVSEEEVQAIIAFIKSLNE